MREIAEAAKDAEVARIKSAKKPDLSPAKPLMVKVAKSGRRYGYAIWKQRKSGRNKRDWYGLGNNPEHMMDALRVTVSNPELSIIKFPNSVYKRAIIRELADEMFDLSRLGEKAGYETAAKYLEKALKRAVK